MDVKRLQDAVSAFWGSFSAAFPEVVTGDSQLSGEDEGALALWAYGSTGDYPTTVYNLPVNWVVPERISTALENGMASAAGVLFEGAAPAAPELTKCLLRDCIQHVLHWNPPLIADAIKAEGQDKKSVGAKKKPGAGPSMGM